MSKSIPLKTPLDPEVWAKPPAPAQETLTANQLRLIFETSRDGICIASRDGTIVDANQAYLDMIGYRHEEIGTFTFADVTPASWRKADQRILNAQLYEHGYTDVFEKEYFRRDGTVFPVSVRCVLLKDPADTRNLHVAIVRDLTEAKRSENARRDSDALFRGIFERAAIGIRVGDMNGDCIATNPALQRMLGYTEQELHGLHFRVYTHPQDREVDTRLFRELVEGSRQEYQFEKRFVRKDGSIFWARLTVSRIGHRAPGRPFYVALTEDFTERKDAADAMRTAKEEAESASRAKSEFLANMSHELRTPLNAILGFSDLMKREVFGPVDNSRYAGYLTDINDAAAHLHQVIGNILDLSKIEAGKYELIEGDVDLTEIAGACVRMMRQQASQKDITLTADLPAGGLWLRADDGNLRQIILNLLSNALKFTPSGGQVWVTTSRDADGTFRLVVGDSGIGMGPEQLPRALELFGQVDSGTNRKYEGTGLGLPLCEAFVRLHGGTFDIESSDGQGTVVTVTFPAVRGINAGGSARTA